ncbi:MAG: TIGR03790 family protein [Planctomycetota bacterium]
MPAAKRYFTLILICLISFGFLKRVDAGGGPENLLLVVNADSPSSKMIANYYIALRQIPSQNVVYLNGLPDSERTSLDEFRKRILKPVFEEIQNRGLANSIDYIVYSADFPTAINIAEHWKKFSERFKNLPADKQPDRRVFTPVASINSLTFYASAIMADEPSYMMLDANNYFRKPASVLLRKPFGGELQKRFEQLRAGLDVDSDEKLRNSASTLEALYKKNPGQLAVAYALAQCYGKLGEGDKSAQWLGRSVQLGWMFRKQTEADQLFENVADNDMFQRVLDLVPDSSFDFVPTRGFRSRYAFGPNGMINSTPGQGNRHYLSTVLAITRNQGNNEREALEQLQRSIRADATRPQGTFYFVETADIRSKTRQPEFQVAIDALKALGYPSEIIKTKMPVRAKDVLGVTSGTARFNWTQTGSRFVPGAIGDNFTSYGGRMDSPGQTKLTEFLRNGAAGASGTVIEPYAIAQKFPSPMLHVHYARGCSLAESFYQSVSGPTQLMIVGDALCRPFAVPPTIEVKGLQPNAKIKGPQIINFDTSQSPVRVAAVQWYLDGRLIHQQANDGMFVMETSGLSDGYHEIRAVAIGASMIESTGRKIIPILIDNQERNVELSSKHQTFLDTDTLKLSAKSNWGDAIGLVHNGRMIAQERGQNVEFEVKATLLGRGPIKLEAVALDDDPKSKSVSSLPITLEIEGRLSTLRKNTNPRKKNPEKKPQ